MEYISVFCFVLLMVFAVFFWKDKKEHKAVSKTKSCNHKEILRIMYSGKIEPDGNEYELLIPKGKLTITDDGDYKIKEFKLKIFKKENK